MAVRLQIVLLREFEGGLDWYSISRVSISGSVRIIILRVTWKRGDERLFLIREGSIILSEEDFEHLQCFPGIEWNGGNYVDISEDLFGEWSNIEQELLLPLSSRGNQSFAFGHFATEVIRDIQLLKGWPQRLPAVLIFPLENWSRYLLRYYRLDGGLVYELAGLDWDLSVRPKYSALRATVRFYRYEDSLSVNDRLPMRTLRFRGVDGATRICFLIRDETSNRPKRWENIEECMKKIREKVGESSVGALSTSSLDIKEFIRSVVYMGSPGVYVSAPGSGAFSPLLYTDSIVLMPTVCSFGESVESWESHLRDFVPFSERLVLIRSGESGTLLTSSVNRVDSWDKPFNVDPAVLSDIVIRVLELKRDVERLGDNNQPTDQRLMGRRLVEVCGTIINVPISMKEIA